MIALAPIVLDVWALVFKTVVSALAIFGVASWDLG